MSRVRFHSMEAIEKMSTFYWGGPNWENWDNDKPVDENLEANKSEKMGKDKRLV